MLQQKRTLTLKKTCTVFIKVRIRRMQIVNNCKAVEGELPEVGGQDATQDVEGWAWHPGSIKVALGCLRCHMSLHISIQLGVIFCSYQCFSQTKSHISKYKIHPLMFKSFPSMSIALEQIFLLNKCCSKLCFDVLWCAVLLGLWCAVILGFP